MGSGELDSSGLDKSLETAAWPREISTDEAQGVWAAVRNEPLLFICLFVCMEIGGGVRPNSASLRLYAMEAIHTEVLSFHSMERNGGQR